MFGADDLAKLDGGYSVSDSADEVQSMLGPNIDGSALRGVRADMMSPNSPALGENMGDEDFEGQDRNNQFNNALLGELGTQKTKYGKAIR